MTEPRRITDAAATPNAADVGMLTSIRNEYSSVCPFSGDCLLLVTNAGYYRLCDANGLYLCDLPFDITMGAQPRWSRKIPALLYYLLGNQIRSYNVDTRASDPVRTFPEYISVSGKGESDIVGTSMVLLGETQRETQEVFVYDLGTGAKGPELDVTGQGTESLYLSADGEPLVSSPTGVDLYDASMNLRHKITWSNPHKCMARDANGNAVLVWCGSDDAALNCNGIVVTQLAEGTGKIIAKLPWNLAFHLASPEQAGFVIVSTYHDPNSQLTKDCGPSEFDDAILRVALDGSGITKLADTGSVGDGYEAGQPRATCNRKGDRIAWGSNQGGSTVDTFMLSLAADSRNPRARKQSKPGVKPRRK